MVQDHRVAKFKNKKATFLWLVCGKGFMRAITNRANLPEPLVRAIQLDPYDASGCDYSTTTLIKPPRIVALEKQHADEIVEDASDRIWSLMGQIGHLILERAGMGELVERRFKMAVYGRVVGGQVDLWKENTLLDYKFTSIWSAMHGVKPEWEQQMNINAALCQENGVNVEKAEIVAIYRDWSVGEARRHKDYPQRQVQVLPVKLWPIYDQHKFMIERVKLHEAAIGRGPLTSKCDFSESNLPQCSPLERWAKPDKWALLKKGQKRALRLFDSEDIAESVAEDMNDEHIYIEFRPGVNVRCLDYCSVSQWCEQFKKLKNESNRGNFTRSQTEAS